MTRLKLEKFLLKHLKSKSAVKRVLMTPCSAFGDMTAIEFGEKVGWLQVEAIFRRIYE